jgi:hypothetical protein
MAGQVIRMEGGEENHTEFWWENFLVSSHLDNREGVIGNFIKIYLRVERWEIDGTDSGLRPVAVGVKGVERSGSVTVDSVFQFSHACL